MDECAIPVFLTATKVLSPYIQIYCNTISNNIEPTLEFKQCFHEHQQKHSTVYEKI